AMDHFVRNRTRLDFSLPRYNSRNANTALVNITLSSSERIVIRGTFPVHDIVHVSAIVRIEDDQGIVGQIKHVQFIQNPSDAFIQTFDHRGHDGIVLLSAWIYFITILCYIGQFSLKGRVYGEMPEAQEERRIAVYFEVIQC